MPMRWRRIAWFFSFATAVVLSTEMRHLGFGWPAALGLAVIVWIVLPFVISQLCAAFILIRTQRRIGRADVDGLADEIADAVKGLPPREQEAIAKRMIDESLK
jgi:hypothetical protein